MPGLVLQARPHDTVGDATRVGYTASRKVGGAVQRNRARRRLRAAAGEVIPRYAKAGFDLVLIARGGTVSRPYKALVADLQAALKRVGAWREVEEEGVPRPDPGESYGELKTTS